MRRYGPRHRALRAKWAPKVDTGTVQCARCHQPIRPGERWDLGHRDGARRDEYAGPEHTRCNRATRTHIAATRTRPPETHPGLIGD